MIDLSLIIVILCFIIMMILFKSKWTEDRLNKANENICEQWIAERDKWHVERQQLLDRIQAPSFSEYKQQEVKVIKAQSGEKEPPKLDPL